MDNYIEQIKEILIDEMEYSEQKAESFLQDFPQLHPEPLSALKKWLDDRTIVETDFQGITIQEIMDNFEGNFLMALKRINRLFDEDLTDEEKKSFVDSLKKPGVIW
jgi:hypothetical protein